MKLKIYSLRALGCGPLRDVCIHFNSEGEHPITVLAGANGSGKTTVLELLVDLAQMIAPDFVRERVPLSLVRAEAVHLTLLVDERPFSVYYGHKPASTEMANESLGWVRSSYFIREQSGTLANEISAAIHHQEGQTIEASGDDVVLRGDVPATLLVLPSILYFPHQRFIEAFTGQQLHRELTTYQWVRRIEPAREFAGSLDSYLIWLEYSEPEKFAEVIAFLNGLNLDGKTFGILRKELRSVVTTRDGQVHSVSDLSSGEQNLVILLLEMRRRLLPGSIVLIDEIENSLHPAFQYRVAEGLVRLQEQIPFQLIVTTHSPTFVDIFGTASTRILTEF